jgi:hypothetical protein
MKFLTEAEKKIKNPKLFSVMEDYKKFIKDAIKKKNVLSKKFYVVIPFTPLELGVAKSILSSLRPSKSKGPLPFPKSYVVRKAKIALFPKRDHLIRQAGRLQIKLRPLTTEDLIKLFYNVYNPESPVSEKEIFN